MNTNIHFLMNVAKGSIGQASRFVTKEQRLLHDLKVKISPSQFKEYGFKVELEKLTDYKFRIYHVVEANRIPVVIKEFITDYFL